MIRPELMAFLGDDPIVCHNAPFEQSFLLSAMQQLKIAPKTYRFVDTLMLSRKRWRPLPNYQLKTVAEQLGIGATTCHRALPDCYLTYGVYTQLNEN